MEKPMTKLTDPILPATTTETRIGPGWTADGKLELAVVLSGVSNVDVNFKALKATCKVDAKKFDQDAALAALIAKKFPNTTVAK